MDFHFILNYKDLFYEKFSKIYFLIVFDYKESNYWKFGLPIFKKYKFIYNYDSKIIGFFNKNNDNGNNNNDLSNNNSFKENGLVILIIILILLLLVLGLIFFGVLIGKKLYKARKIRTNELPDLYDYNSINK